MAEQRYIEAVLRLRQDSEDQGTVFVPLADDQDDAPVTLADPLPGFGGAWSRESERGERPARYLRVG